MNISGRLNTTATVGGVLSELAARMGIPVEMTEEQRRKLAEAEAQSEADLRAIGIDVDAIRAARENNDDAGI